MGRLLWILCIFCSSVIFASDSYTQAKEEISVTATGEPSSFVNNVSTIFGNLLLSSVDLPSAGPHALPLVRYYNSQLSYVTWLQGMGMTSNYPLWIKGLPIDEAEKYAYINAEEDGGAVICGVSEFHEKSMSFYLDPETIHRGLTNASDEISARTNLKNTHYKMKGHWKDSRERGRFLKASWTSLLSNGGERKYFSTEFFENAMNVMEETKPNGTTLSFDYYSDPKTLGFLKEIKSRSHHHTFAWLKVDYKLGHKKVTVTSSTGREVTYSFDLHDEKHRGKPPFIEKVSGTDLPTTRYSYDTIDGRRLISKIEYPNGRYLKLSYDEKGRVTKQKAPIGKDGAEQTAYSFSYHPKDRTTVVHDANNHKTIYHYSSKDRLTRVEKFKDGKKPYRSQGRLWGKKETIHKGKRDDSDEGHLLAKTLYDSDRMALYAQQYTYDSHGNIKEETIYGNLSGRCATKFDVSDDGHPEQHHIEKYRKKYSYSDDRLHLKTDQTEESGPRITYTYQKGTDLLTAKYTYDGHQLKIREFFEYDEDAVQVKRIVDNGSSTDPSKLSHVTERMITHITPVRNRDDHGVGQPALVQECYLDISSGREVQLKRTEYSYTKAGLLQREKVYDAFDQHRYTISTVYNEKNLAIRKSDAIGREYTFKYDDAFNKIKEELLGSGLFTTFTYDRANRLIQKTDHHNDGLKFSTSYTHDAVGNVLSSTDHFGQTTTYEYDELNRLCATILPSTQECSSPTTKKDYDLFDNVSSQTCANGNTTTSTYTVRHQPATINYPDGSFETYEYNLNGTLAKKRERNGSRKEFCYDFLGRITVTTVIDAEGTPQTTTSNTYNAFHCISSTDPMGHTTFFEYDGAGRLLRVRKDDHCTEYGYDSLGRKTTTSEATDDGQWLITQEGRDLADRIIEVRKTCSDGTLLSLQRFSYDMRSNRTETISFTTIDTSTTTHTEYSTRNVPTRVIDPLGNCTEISYDYGYKNDLNQRVLRKTTKDPLGNLTIETLNALSRPETLERRAADGALLAKTIFQYDKKGNKTQEKEFVIVNGVSTREYVIEWTYTSMDQVATVTEEPHTQNEKTTRYTYTKSGLVETIFTPNGVRLTHTYDGLSRLSSLQSSDDTISYAYAYDRNNNPISVVDRRLNIVRQKTYDRFGHILTEDLSPGLSVAYCYDRIGRCTSYSINGTPAISYEYHNGHLTDVIRKNSMGEELYRHRYAAIDLEEKVTQSSLIKNLGIETILWDKKGRVLSLNTPYWQETIPVDGYDAAGNLHRVHIHDAIGDIWYGYSYDSLYQLIREEGPFSNDYSYDSINNRLKKNGSSYQINTLNQLLSDNTSTFRYDKNGNPIEIGPLHLTYDALDRLASIENPTEYRLEFSYDSSHRRTGQTKYFWEDSSWQQTDEKRFVYCGDREIGAIGSLNELLEFRVLGRGKGAELGASVAIELEGTVFCPLHDHRGNITALIDPVTPLARETYRYSAFGEEALFGMTGVQQPSSCNPWRLASKRTDPETGLVFFGKRYYSRQTGRFLTTDPVGFSDGPNLYAYVHNCPLALIDPYGLTALDTSGAPANSHLASSASTSGQYILNDGTVIEKNKYYEHSVFVYPDGKTFVSAHTEQDLGPEKVGFMSTGMNTSMYDACTYAEAMMTGSKSLEHVIMEYQNVSLGPEGILDAMVAITTSYRPTTRLLANQEEALLKECQQANLRFVGVRSGHSLGVPTSEAIKNIIGNRNREFLDYFGKSTYFGGPVQPRGALNYAATSDPISWLSSHLAPLMGREVVSVPSPGVLSSKAHSFLGPAYQEAVRDAFTKRGIQNPKNEGTNE